MQDVEPRPSRKITLLLFALVFAAMGGSILWLGSVDDPVRLKALIEDSGPVQLTGQTAIAMAFALSLVFCLIDRQRRSSFLMLSYLLMFYTLREADYHYKVSEHAKATQFKRFFSHEMIPISTKLFLAAIVILFLVVLYKYLRKEKDTFLVALRNRLPWALFAFAWGVVFFMSQFIDQVPVFHTVHGQVFEEVFEASAEVLALLSIILFWVQVNGDARQLQAEAAT
jgi:hypothetical protein